MSEKTEELKDKSQKAVSMSINRVPMHTFKSFKKLASELFADDYGAALTYLIYREDIRTEFYGEMEDFEERLSQLEAMIHKIASQDETKESESKTIG